MCQKCEKQKLACKNNHVENGEKNHETRVVHRQAWLNYE